MATYSSTACSSSETLLQDSHPEIPTAIGPDTRGELRASDSKARSILGDAEHALQSIAYLIRRATMCGACTAKCHGSQADIRRARALAAIATALATALLAVASDDVHLYSHLRNHRTLTSPSTLASAADTAMMSAQAAMLAAESASGYRSSFTGIFARTRTCLTWLLLLPLPRLSLHAGRPKTISMSYTMDKVVAKVVVAVNEIADAVMAFAEAAEAANPTCSMEADKDGDFGDVGDAGEAGEVGRDLATVETSTELLKASRLAVAVSSLALATANALRSHLSLPALERRASLAATACMAASTRASTVRMQMLSDLSSRQLKRAPAPGFGHLRSWSNEERESVHEWCRIVDALGKRGTRFDIEDFASLSTGYGQQPFDASLAGGVLELDVLLNESLKTRQAVETADTKPDI